MESWVFENVDKIWSRLIKKIREKTQITKFWNERGNIAIKFMEMRRIIVNKNISTKQTTYMNRQNT